MHFDFPSPSIILFSSFIPFILSFLGQFYVCIWWSVSFLDQMRVNKSLENNQTDSWAYIRKKKRENFFNFLFTKATIILLMLSTTLDVHSHSQGLFSQVEKEKKNINFLFSHNFPFFFYSLSQFSLSPVVTVFYSIGKGHNDTIKL